MANENGTRSDNIEPGNLLTEFIGNNSSGTKRVKVDAVATQLLSTNPFKILTNSARLYATYDALVASGDAAVTPWVFADPDAAKNGIYRQVAGVWTWSLPLPYSFITATAVEGEGTPSAIHAVTGIPTSEDALIILQVAETNDASPVTVSFNDGPALTVKSNSGNDIVVGGLVAGMQVMGVIAGATFRIVTDQVSAAVLAQAEAAAGTAVSAKTDAVAAMGLADRFANAPEDEEVTPGSGLFSAFHWMKKAFTLGTGMALGAAAFLNVGTSAGTVAAGDDPRLGQGVPVGFIGDFPINDIPLGWLVADGSTFNEELYSDLYAYLGTNVLPDYTDRVRRMAGPLAGEAGTTQDDQMQRITGTIPANIGGSTNVETGVFTSTNNGNLTFAGGAGTLSNHLVTFDSANSPGARVGDETRVKAAIVVTCIKAFGAVATEGMADLAALLTAISSQAEAEAGADNTKLMTPLRVRQATKLRNSGVITLSGTSFEVTGIPAGVQRVMLDVKMGTTNGSSRLELGDASGYPTSGYAGAISAVGAASVSSIATNAAYIGTIGVATSPAQFVGRYEMSLQSGNVWLVEGIVQYLTNGNLFVNVLVSGLVGNLSRLRLSSGSAATLSGEAKVWWEF